MSEMPKRIWAEINRDGNIPVEILAWSEQDTTCDELQEYIRADLAAEREAALMEVLKFAERRSRQPGEGHTAYFERLAEEFFQRFGYLAPGKDDPMNSVSQNERRKAWEDFLNEPVIARRKALAAAGG